ncbi:MAG TPA: LysM peptidoglycan-binding domain-containing protein [Longimicrobium sp.]|jgi:membrane-bound lytic murein transglycosylase D|nr:LysM peptidoglycan-binding domain-containing protein [Longimicrobium sp.]
MRTRVGIFLLLCVAAMAPSPAPAQRDTIRLGARDTVSSTAADTAVAPARDPRWSTPFAVEASGRVAPLRAPRDVVWLDADSVRARRRAARLAAAASDSAAEDSAAAEPPADSAAATDTAAAPPPRRTRRAAADSAATPRRTGTRTAARDTASTRRAASADTAGRARTTARRRTHRVASGETLFGIARRYGVTTAQVRALNPELVAGELETGTVLRLPAGARTASADTARAEGRRRTAETAEPAARRPAAETRPAPRGRRTHAVAAHETLFGIARRYGVTVDALKAANRLTGDALRTGQTLVIPASPPR